VESMETGRGGGRSVSRRLSHEVWMFFTIFKIDVRLSRCMQGGHCIRIHAHYSRKGR